MEPTHEIWVTEPESTRFEVYRLEDGKPPRAVRVAAVATERGPESLVPDLKHRRAYTNVMGGTAAIDLRLRSATALWGNACNGASGIALDNDRGFLFVACFAGGIRVLDLASGAIVDSTRLGAGVDIISYSPNWSTSTCRAAGIRRCRFSASRTAGRSRCSARAPAQWIRTASRRRARCTSATPSRAAARGHRSVPSKRALRAGSRCFAEPHAGV
jgi:hypothetical protein